MRKCSLIFILTFFAGTIAHAEINMPTKRDRDKASGNQRTFVTSHPAAQYVAENTPPEKSAHMLNNEDALYLDAIRALQSGQYEAARAKLAELERSATDPDLKAEAAAAIGDSFYEQGDMGSARDSYERAIRLYPGNDQTEYIKGRLSQMGQMPAHERPAVSAAQPAPSANRDAAQTPVVRTPDRGNFSVQVGSFKAAQNASKLIAQLKGKSYDAYRLKIGKLYRVRVGHLASRSDAEGLAARLQKDGYPTRVTS